tara:strand:- start:519 stop:1853 length:1335 start_codon:yes stop_codon:yes gene_type:complete
MTEITLQIYLDGSWHDAAVLDISAPERGIASPTVMSGYELDYYAEQASIDFSAGTEVIDIRALSVGIPANIAHKRWEGWPPFLLDLMPQGNARRRLAGLLNVDEDDPAAELPILLRGAGAPIGNIRVKEAWLDEERRIGEAMGNGALIGVQLQDIINRTDAFMAAVDQYGLVASGSSGVQGEWPKILMTQSSDNLWYPDPCVADEGAKSHVIVKLDRVQSPEFLKILEAEAPYLEVARAFGTRTAAPLRYENGVLIIPRFDRRVSPGSVERFGQESLVSAIGVAKFGHIAAHETYVQAIADFSTDAESDVKEYLLRDLLNRAMGNPDNHGRNSALQKMPDGSVRLSPLYDFAPMRMSPDLVIRSTKWACMGAPEHTPDWNEICAAVSEISGVAKEDLIAFLRGKEDLLRNLPEIAREKGVSVEVIERAFRIDGAVAGILALRDE